MKLNMTRRVLFGFLVVIVTAQLAAAQIRVSQLGICLEHKSAD